MQLYKNQASVISQNPVISKNSKQVEEENNSTDIDDAEEPEF